MPKVVIIEGLIGAGKTTILSILKEKLPNCCCIYEPVDLWESSGELSRFYQCLNNENPSSDVYKFQTYTFITRIKRIIDEVTKNPNADYYILERSIFSDRYFFIEMLRESGKLNQKDYEMYLTWWELWEKVMPIKPTHFIYLNPSVEECMKRLKGRNRDSESGVSKEYQIALKEKHDEFFGKSTESISFLNLQTDDDFRENVESITKILKFIE